MGADRSEVVIKVGGTGPSCSRLFAQLRTFTRLGPVWSP